MNEAQTDSPVKSSGRFSRNDLFYFASLIMLFIVLALQFSLPVAMTVIGAIGVSISIINSYFMVWFYRSALKK